MSSQVTIVDFLSGRGFGGHYDDYLAALTDALAEYSPEVIAPFAQGRPEPGGRFGIYREEFSGYRRALKKSDAVVVHSAQFSDYLCLWAAARSVRKRDRATCLLVLRRSPTPESMAVGDERLGRFLIKRIVGMIRRGVIHPVSDSAVALDAWLKTAPGVEGELVALPPVPGAADGETPTIKLPTPNGPLVAIAGRMRGEKGSANYPEVVDATLELLPDGAIALQTCEDDEVSRVALQKIRAAHDGDPRVALLGEHLTGADYHALLSAADIVVLPYDVAVYGTGTSGVVSDALALGAVVVVSPIEWVVSEFSRNPRVVLLNSSVKEALESAVARLGSASSSESGADFAASWQAALLSTVGSP
ncbi:MAG: glycosyltransferase [Thermoleophilaceae bacterium]|nr:glycosyltransferase [Thermoleophilaceae bacterium]